MGPCLSPRYDTPLCLPMTSCNDSRAGRGSPLAKANVATSEVAKRTAWALGRGQVSGGRESRYWAGARVERAGMAVALPHGRRLCRGEQPGDNHGPLAGTGFAVVTEEAPCRNAIRGSAAQGLHAGRPPTLRGSARWERSALSFAGLAPWKVPPWRRSQRAARAPRRSGHRRCSEGSG